MLGKIWGGMFNLLDSATVNYERQFRASQKLRGKMIRLLQHTKTKLDIYKDESTRTAQLAPGVCHLTVVCIGSPTARETDQLKERLEEKETELMDMRVQLTGLERQIASLTVRAMAQHLHNTATILSHQPPTSTHAGRE